MEKRLTADLNVVANSNLEIQLLDGDLNIIQKLDDEPNDVGGLTSAELKAKFDESGNIIKKYINETLIPAVLTDDATEESRKQAEAARVAAEQGRVTAEEGRVSAETARAAAEQARSEAEASRVSAENARAAAETARADETAGIVARATEHANAAAGSASQAAGSEQSAKDAAGTATGAAISASQSETAASGSASQASAAAAAAAGSAAGAETASKTAQSWAVGGTGTRPGEDTDNAKYWAEKAQAVVGGDFATKVEAQGYVTAHNESNVAHSDIRKALEGKAAATHASQHGKDGADPITPAAIGAASLGADGKVPASQLPETNTYTKDEILKDATAAKFGKDTGAVPDEVLDVLSKSVLEGTYPVVDVYAGQNWQKGSATGGLTPAAVFGEIISVNGIFVSMPSDTGSTNALKSLNGKNWEQFQVPKLETYWSYGSRRVMLYAKSKYYLICYCLNPYQVKIYSGETLGTWELISSLNTKATAINFFFSESLDAFILIDTAGNISISIDAITWTQNIFSIGSASAGSLHFGENGIDGVNGFFVAVGDNTAKKIRIVKITLSQIETIWESPQISWTSNVTSFILFKNKYYVYTSNAIAYSDNLENWLFLETDQLTASFVQYLAHSDNTVIGPISNTDVCISLDGLNFKNISHQDVVTSFANLAFGGGIFVGHSAGTPSTIKSYYTPDTTFKDEPGLVDVLGNMVNIPLKQIAGAASIEIGTYTGTGTKNTSLKTNGRPRLIMIFREQDGANYYPIFCIALLPDKDVTSTETYWIPNFSFSSSMGGNILGYPLLLDGLNANSLLLRSVYSDTQYVLNASGVTYRYLLMYMDN